MKYTLYILFALTTTILRGQNGRFQPSKDLRVTIDTLHPWTFKQKLDTCSNFRSKYISLKYNNLDTVNCKLTFDLEFAFSKKVLNVLFADLCADSTIITTNKLIIKSNMLTWVNNSKMRQLRTESKIDIAEINGKVINKKLPILIHLKSNETSPVLTIYIESEKGSWYLFSYYKNVMSAVSSNQQFNLLLKNNKIHYKNYESIICSSTKKDMFIRKLNHEIELEEIKTTRH